ncbi:MAG: FAD:protein FMN transferase [bacterium]|nr:FAD:protein FMN transferase [bacterium]
MKKFFLLAAVCFMGILSCGCGEVKPRRVQSTDVAMGTVIQQVLYTVSDDGREAEEILRLLNDLEQGLLSKRLETSEVFAVNEAVGAQDGVLLSPALSEIVAACLEMWERSDGCFDITLGEAVALWDIDKWASEENTEEFELPDREALQRALERCGSGKLVLEDGRLFLPEGVQLDLGAAGKGVAMDEILSFLQENDTITGATISLGGSVLTYGEKPDKSLWRIGVRNPADVSANIGILSLEGQWCISTSGDYERYVELDGVRYHHILDPATGYPADSGVAGVTVLSKNGLLSDALSTACFILGPERGIPLAESYGAEALFVGKDGSLEMSDGMRRYFSRE